MALAVGHSLYASRNSGTICPEQMKKENIMTIEASRQARDLLRISLNLLDDDESLTAVAMISGALDLLERRAEPAALRPTMAWHHLAKLQPAGGDCRSCA